MTGIGLRHDPIDTTEHIEVVDTDRAQIGLQGVEYIGYRYNTPGHPLTLEQIVSRGVEFYARHPERHIFNRVWFLDSLNSADDLNALLGLPPGYGDVKWLAQLWPVFGVDQRSSGR